MPKTPRAIKVCVTVTLFVTSEQMVLETGLATVDGLRDV